MNKVPKRGKKAQKFAKIRIENPSLNKKQALVAAGYTPDTNPKTVENTKSYRVAVQSLQNQRQGLQETQGLTFTDSATFYRDLSQDEANDPADRIRARKQLDTILGYEAPKEVNIRKIGLLLELKDLTTADLQSLAGMGSNE
jgi:hypothetical protein